MDVLQGPQFAQRVGRLVDHLLAVRVLPNLAIHAQAHAQLRPPLPLVGRQKDQAGADRPEAAVALALVELPLRQLHVARRQVVDDGHPGEPLAEIIRAHDGVGRQAAPQHEPELDFVVEQAHVRRTDHRGLGRGDAGGGLGEERVEREVLGTQSGLVDVAQVVDALADELLVVRHGRQQLDRVDRERGARILDVPEQFPVVGQQVAGGRRLDGQGGDQRAEPDAPLGDGCDVVAHEADDGA